MDDCSHLNSIEEITTCINDILASTNCQVGHHVITHIASRWKYKLAYVTLKKLLIFLLFSRNAFVTSSRLFVDSKHTLCLGDVNKE